MDHLLGRDDERLDRLREQDDCLLLIVDEKFHVVYQTEEIPSERIAEFCPEPGVLRPDLREIAEKFAQLRSERAIRSTYVPPGFIMRVHRLRGSTSTLYAVLLEPFRSREPLRIAARRYALTKRESEILVLILAGADSAEIATTLHLSAHTVQGYFKRLLKKTGSRNRPAMVAKVLDWNNAQPGLPSMLSKRSSNTV